MPGQQIGRDSSQAWGTWVAVKELWGWDKEEGVLGAPERKRNSIRQILEILLYDLSAFNFQEHL